MSLLSDKYPGLPWREIFEFGEKYRVEDELICAVMMQESGGNQYATRYEPRWKYWADPERYALNLGSTVETERMGQATSFGYMQIMGAVARELNFTGWFGMLYLPSYNVNLGTAKLAKLLHQYRDPFEVLAAYNAGKPRRDSKGNFLNQGYVDSVIKRYKEMKAISAKKEN